MTTLSRLRAPWPQWSGRWFGILVRTLILLIGLLGGLIILFWAAFAATYKKDIPEWEGEALAVLMLGLACLVIGPAAAIRPSRLTWGLAGSLVILIPLVGAII